MSSSGWMSRLKHALERVKAISYLFGKLQLLRFVWRQAIKDRCLQMASALGFQMIFSLIPILALAVLLLPGLGQSALEAITRELGFDEIRFNARGMASASRPSDDAPEEAGKQKLSDWINDRMQSLQTGLTGVSLPVISFVVLIFTATSLMVTLEHSLGQIHGVRKGRSLVLRVLIYWSVITLSPLAIGLASQLNAMLTAKLFSWAPTLLGWIQNRVLPWFGASLGLFLIYYLMPNTHVSLRAAVISAAVAGVGFECGKELFGLYVSQAVGYGEIYGNLALVPLFFFWVWVMFIIVLFGAELCYTIQHVEALSLEEEAAERGHFVRADELTIAVVSRICHHFHRGLPPVRRADLLDLAVIEPGDLDRLLDALVACELVRPVDGDRHGYVPSRPPSRLRVVDVLACVESRLLDTTIPPALSPTAGVNSLLNTLAGARRELLQGLTIEDLIASTEHSNEGNAPPAGDQGTG